VLSPGRPPVAVLAAFLCVLCVSGVEAFLSLRVLRLPSRSSPLSRGERRLGLPAGLKRVLEKKSQRDSEVLCIPLEPDCGSSLMVVAWR